MVSSSRNRVLAEIETGRNQLFLLQWFPPSSPWIHCSYVSCSAKSASAPGSLPHARLAAAPPARACKFPPASLRESPHARHLSNQQSVPGHCVACTADPCLFLVYLSYPIYENCYRNYGLGKIVSKDHQLCSFPLRNWPWKLSIRTALTTQLFSHLSSLSSI